MTMINASTLLTGNLLDTFQSADVLKATLLLCFFNFYLNEKVISRICRMKELIKVKGLQVAPSELEDLLRTHPEVADVAVIG